MNWTSEKRKLSELIPWEKNPRQLTDKQAKHLTESIRKFGQVIPYSIGPDGQIYDGHQRQHVMGMMDEYGADCEVDVRVSERVLTEDERRELVIRLHENTGEWDFDGLANLYDFEELKDWGFDEGLLDYLKPDDPKEDPGAQIDRAEELREKWGVESGQLWQLGEHRVICGDCTDKAAVDRLMAGERAQICFTSPPYYNQRPEYSIFESYEDYNDFLSGVVDAVISVSDSVFILAWNTGDNQPDCLPMIADQTVLIHSKGLTYLDTIIWRKSGAVYSIPRSAHIKTHAKYYPALSWEPIIVFRSGDKMPSFDNKDKGIISEYGTNVWEIRQVIETRSKGHPAMFPEELADRVIRCYSSSNNNAYEPFLGGGTTLIACERLNRKCYGVEIEPKYVAVTLERWHEMTGEMPIIIEN